MKKLEISVLALALFMGACSSVSNETGAERRNAPVTGQNNEAVKKEEPGATMRYTKELEEGEADEEFVQHNTESYDYIEENNFLSVIDQPLSTFSIDVDNASYTNTRRFLENGSLPPTGAVRIEEFINYFDYDYPVPKSKEVPFSITTEVSKCPWNSDNLLMHVGLQGYTIPTEELPPSNLVFLIDVSGSMNSPNKLDLLKQSFKQLISKLGEDDRVSIVVYAGSSGVVLNPTSGSNRFKLIRAINSLRAGGSTAGAEGLELAYDLAEQNLMENGNNRIILATDGDFNVGQSSNAHMRRMVENHRDKGIYVTVLGFGMGNYKDSKMEVIADHGNGNYFYIDDISESRRVLVDNLARTLFTIAKDVKIQVEFNPAVVRSYRLIGYENRLMNAEDFNDDKKDAGELGAGHTVTAIYELVPGEGIESIPLKYQTKTVSQDNKDEIGVVKFRYKLPDATTSKLLTQVVKKEATSFDQSSDNMRFSASVASFGMLLNNSQYSGTFTYNDIIEVASSAVGQDSKGERAGFIRLVKLARDLEEVALLEGE